MNRRILLCIVLALGAVTTVGCKDSDTPPKDPQGKTAEKRRQEETAEKLKIPVEMTLKLGEGVTMKLALIPAGKFLMGSGVSVVQLARHYKRTAEPFRDEFPQREVTITKPFYMGVTQVTQAQWRAVMGTEPWKGETEKEGGENAASHVSWDDVAAFCQKVSQKGGRAVRLPTEAEWEYACRAGSKTRYCFGDDDSKLGDYAWYNKNASDIGERYAHPVARKKPNAWGLYDMHGNVWEWCADWYDKTYYSAGGNTVDPRGPAFGSSRVVRASTFGSIDWDCRSADRNGLRPDLPWNVVGCRVVLPVVDPKAPK